MNGTVTVDITGAQMGGAARCAAGAPLPRPYRTPGRQGRRSRRASRPSVATTAGAMRAEGGPPNRGQRVRFVGPGGQRWALLRNALHFLTGNEATHLEPGLRKSVQREAVVVRLAVRRADVLVVPSSAMAERVAHVMPAARSRIVVRPHPVSAGSFLADTREAAILCPVLFAPYKRMDERLAELLNAVDDHGDETVRVGSRRSATRPRWTATRSWNSSGRSISPDLRQAWASSQAIYFPTGLESFGYPLAEARANGQPVIALDSAQNREIAGAYVVRLRSGRSGIAAPCGQIRPHDAGDAGSIAVRSGRLFRLATGEPRMTMLELRPYRASRPLIRSVPKRDLPLWNRKSDMLMKQRGAGPPLRQDHLPSPSGSPGDSPDPVSRAPLPGTLPSQRGGPGSRFSQQPRDRTLP